MLRAQEPWLERWTSAGFGSATRRDAVELVTAFVVGFVIEEQERAQSDEAGYSIERRDALLGERLEA